MLARERWQTLENSWKNNTILNEHPVLDKVNHDLLDVVIHVLLNILVYVFPNEICHVMSWVSVLRMFYIIIRFSK